MCKDLINCVRRRRTLPNRDVTVRCQVKSRSGVVAFASFWCSHVNDVAAARIIYLLLVLFIFLYFRAVFLLTVSDFLFSNVTKKRLRVPIKCLCRDNLSTTILV